MKTRVLGGYIEEGREKRKEGRKGRKKERKKGEP